MQIEIRNLTKFYKDNVQALKGVNLSISGGIFGLVGPNGAGKTTLIRILAGILQPTDGTLYVNESDGTTEKGRAEIKKSLGYLPQDLGMYPDLSAREFLDYIGILKGVGDRKKRSMRVEELLELVALQDVAQRKLKTYSTGMKRRVGIAQALLNNPQLLIVDEPTAGLDPEERIRFRNLLSDLGGDRTILLSTHIVEDIAQTSHNIAVMKDGQVIFQGTVTEILQETQGKVWLVTADTGSKIIHDFTIVSTLHMGTSVQYRIVGAIPPSHLQATPVEPNLEDGYVWLMHRQGLAVGV